MFQNLLQFEWRYHSKQTSFIVFFLLFLGYGALAIPAAFQYLENSTMYNDAYNLTFLTGIISLGSIFSCMFFCVNGILRDVSNRAEELIFSTGIKKFNFFISRFSGVLLITLLISSISLLGVFIGTLFADLDPNKLHHFDLSHYLWPWLTIILPNVFICTAILFSVTILRRNAISTYVTGILIIAINWISGFYINSPLVGGSSLSSPEILNIATVTDLLGLAAFFEQSQFLTPIEKNDHLLSMSGHFLLNRVLWTALGSALLFGAYQLFSFRKISKKVKKEESISEESDRSTKYVPVAITSDSSKIRLAAFKNLVKLDLKSTFSSIPFLAIIAIWIVMLSIAFNYSINGREVYGAKYPSTDLLLGLIVEILPVLGLLLVVFFSGELVWKTRSNNFHEIIDATPISNGIFFLSKFFVLALIPMLLIFSAILVGIVFQVCNGYYDFQFELYLSTFYYAGLQLVLYAVFALLVQSVVSNKYLGMIISGFIMLLFGPLSSSLGLEHPLFLFNNLPSMARAHSDFTGYGQFITKFNWLALYWTALAGVFVLLSFKSWKRGTDASIKTFLRAIWSKREKMIAGSLVVLFISFGGYIYYNINVVNEYIVADEEYDFNENYERKYKKYDALAVPQLVSVNTNMDIYPEDNKYTVVANNLIANKSAKPMNEIFVTAPKPLKSLTIEQANQVFHDSVLNTYLFEMKTPLIPNQELKMQYSLVVNGTSFNINNAIASNGTYIRTPQFSPYLGYVNQFEINNDYERERRGLAQRDNPVVNDKHLQMGGKFNYETARFETVISTSSDQVAFSSGELVKQWKSNDRSYYHYKSADKIDNMTTYFSARYKVEKVEHRGVSIEIYYHPDHYRNVPEMLKVTKATIDYCTDNFGTYPHKYLRIGEMSKFGGSNGQAMPGVISINERIFKKNIKDPEFFNVVARVLIHEVAHQWWGYLLTPKRINGSMILSESFAKYSETVILEKLYGKAMVRQLSEYTVRRYFSGRSNATEVEPPLYLCQHQQYLAYSKGAIVMSAIKDLIGETALNSTLKNLVTKYHHSPMVTTLDLLEELYVAAPTKHHELIDDWMKRVITYELGITNASYRRKNNDTYEITYSIDAQRYETNDAGKEVEIGMDEVIKIGVFTRDPKEINNEDDILYLKSHLINKKEMEFKIIVDEIPSYISIDPFFTRLDRNALNNIKLVSPE
jgi:ABC-2 type transport system permease protein